MKDRLILAIETSCDETSVAVLRNDAELLSNVIASQIASHQRFGGVVPEVASRHHVEVITACIEEALLEAEVTAEDLTAVAVTYGPGLVGALLVGISAAKAFAWANGLPLIPVNHMAGHLMAGTGGQGIRISPSWHFWSAVGTRSWSMCQRRATTRLSVKREMMRSERLMIRRAGHGSALSSWSDY